MPRRRALAAGWALACAAALPACTPEVDLAEGESGRIVRVSDGDLLFLDTGQAVRLVEIEAPRVGRGPRPSDPFGDAARSLLASAGQGRRARLFYGGLSRDRYDRALAHVIAEDEIGRPLWLNGLMVREGGARVRTFADNARRARSLLALESTARAEGKGLWSLPDYRVLAPRDVLGEAAFALVEGPVLSLAESANDSLARIRPDGFALQLAPRLRDLAPEDAPVAGDPVRVRGRISLRPEAGPSIVLTHWEQVERLDRVGPS